ncbi:uncharacterized protein LOC134339918 [Mobula hypostoma]|uniref:uncharacterized protein LOC134339918 n=1 Tax=Mobula hypostoma TaxID=723540 RepID=UPI002FC28392
METIRQFPWILILVSITCQLCRADVDTDTRNNEDDVIQLSMENNSAAYIYTQSKESDMLAIEYLKKERGINKTLDKAWREALDERQTDPRLSKAPVPRGLREQHVVAIIAYTLETPLYSQFNTAMRMYGANDSVYAEKFPFKSFQYLLSVAIQRLREVLGKTPQPTYRRMRKKSSGKVGSRMKFGYFASTSCKQGEEEFGKKTIFTIFSQYGAQIENYSSIPGEEEVLIPPYEAFKITRYQPRTDGVDISLETDGVAGIRVRVERGSEGEMRVLRCEGTAIFPMTWLSILALLAHFSLQCVGGMLVSPVRGSAKIAIAYGARLSRNGVTQVHTVLQGPFRQRLIQVGHNASIRPFTRLTTFQPDRLARHPASRVQSRCGFFSVGAAFAFGSAGRCLAACITRLLRLFVISAVSAFVVSESQRNAVPQSSRGGKLACSASNPESNHRWSESEMFKRFWFVVTRQDLIHILE